MDLFEFLSMPGITVEEIEIDEPIRPIKRVVTLKDTPFELLMNNKKQQIASNETKRIVDAEWKLLN